jgi:hypothetical protein
MKQRSEIIINGFALYYPSSLGRLGGAPKKLDYE